jgi:hypothetical protein
VERENGCSAFETTRCCDFAKRGEKNRTSIQAGRPRSQKSAKVKFNDQGFVRQ